MRIDGAGAARARGRRVGCGAARDDRAFAARPPATRAALSLSALERYQDCPFKFFAADVLRLEEAPEDEPALSPRARGRFIHEVFQRFFEAWDARGHGTITSDRLDEARALFAEVAAPLLARCPRPRRRSSARGCSARRSPSASSTSCSASRRRARRRSRERWLEYRLEGEFSLGSADGRRVPLKGVADRIDLLDGNRLRVIDYKSGYAPNVKRALQVPIYALCAQERLAERDGAAVEVDEAAYVAFTGKRALVPVIKAGARRCRRGAGGRARPRCSTSSTASAAASFRRGRTTAMICRYCAYASVCRKDYVGDE